MSNQPGSPWGSHDPQNSWGTQPQPPAPKSPNPWQRLVDFVTASRLNAILAGLVGLLAVMLLILAVVIVVPGGNDDKSPALASSGGSSDDGEEGSGSMSEKDLADALNERLDADKESNKEAFDGLTMMPEGETFTIESYRVEKWPSGKEHLTPKGATEYRFSNARIVDTEESPREELGQWELTEKLVCYDVSIKFLNDEGRKDRPYRVNHQVILDDERVADRFGGRKIDRRIGWNGPNRIAAGNFVVDDSDLPERGAEDYTHCEGLDVDVDSWDKVRDSYTGILLTFEFTGSDSERLLTGDLNWVEDEIGIPITLK